MVNIWRLTVTILSLVKECHASFLRLTRQQCDRGKRLRLHVIISDLASDKLQITLLQ